MYGSSDKLAVPHEGRTLDEKNGRAGPKLQFADVSFRRDSADRGDRAISGLTFSIG